MLNKSSSPSPDSTVKVTFASGDTAEVIVRTLGLSEFPKYLARMDDELRLAEFLTGSPAGWADALRVDSVLDIVEKGAALNFVPVMRWLEVRKKLAEAAAPFAAFQK